MALDNITGNFKIDGISVPSPALDGTSFKDIIISRSWDDIHGIFNDKLIRYRKQVTWTYRAMSEENLRRFYSEYIMNHIRNTGNRVFNVTTVHPSLGIIDMKCYLGTPVEFKPVHSTKHKGVVYWEFSLVWTEIEGESLGGESISG